MRLISLEGLAFSLNASAVRALGTYINVACSQTCAVCLNTRLRDVEHSKEATFARCGWSSGNAQVRSRRLHG